MNSVLYPRGYDPGLLSLLEIFVVRAMLSDDATSMKGMATVITLA
jgi:hypothetical protein